MPVLRFGYGDFIALEKEAIASEESQKFWDDVVARASFEPLLTGGLALCFRWANRSPVLQIEKTNTSATTHFEKRMSTGPFPVKQRRAKIDRLALRRKSLPTECRL